MTERQEKLFILTGASRGLGRALAEQLLREAGCTLLTFSRQPLEQRQRHAIHPVDDKVGKLPLA